MDTLIQHRETKQYRTKTGWSADRTAALSFRSSLQALDFCCQNELKDIVLVLRFSNPKFDIHLHPFPEREVENK